ncbi:DUF6686 family protein [Hymenobacter jeollabukensis]|uniref:Uncharacterized protein n=1 Tax=Hymenobacter jeollabukensis TaxID=2025313 RepID=A0A5R8WW34_9BACT|nr:DUF6686 family protein [Hymenobacter jeollabukensis]TLM96666.1 hypothetical protein FDY95_01335 [Hymenobacter jeollabukensis]
MHRCLHSNEFGCALRCPGGCCLHVYFGNVALALKPHELAPWLDTVHNLYNGYALESAQEPDMRRISLRSPVDNLTLLFSLNELMWLNDLLTSSKLLLEVEQILEDS